MGLTVQEGSQNSPGGAVLDIQGFPLSGQAYIPLTVQAVCAAPLGICEPGMVTVARGGQGVAGKDTEKSSEHGIWAEGIHL